MIIKPKVRGFVCVTAHPTGCTAHIQQQIDHVKAKGPIKNGPKRVLVIGASTGYGLASRITAAFGCGAATLGIFFEKEGSETKPGTAGWYNSAAFHKYAQAEGLYAKSINGDAFSDEIKRKAIDTIRADLGQVIGFNGETLGNVSLAYATNGSRLSGLDLSAVTGSGQALVAKLGKGEGTLELTTGDAGALARLTNIYRHMEGGLLNIRLKAGADGSWRGPLDVRKFTLTGEEKLRSMVSTSAGGRSLNEAVRSEIDTSSMYFSRGFAFVVAKDGTLRVENGVVRGDAVGATFQGTVRDRNDRMEMTGTFMPAYGLNRLFAELPLIGYILGNGSDRGLIGITFKLSGAFDRPALVVNPLSIIAPGVFRNIFEF